LSISCKREKESVFFGIYKDEKAEIIPKCDKELTEHFPKMIIDEED
jgi:hypothetical protein